MRLVIRLFGLEILAIEQGDDTEPAEDWSLGGTVSSDRIGFHQPVEQRPDGWDWGEDAT